MFYFFLIYLAVSLTVAYFGHKKNIGFVKALVFSVILTPIIGLIIVANSSKKITYREVQYHCPKCGYYFTEKQAYCPYCIKDNQKISLIQEEVTMT